MNDRYFEIPELQITKSLKKLPYQKYSDISWTSFGHGSTSLLQHFYEPGKGQPEIVNLYHNVFKDTSMLGRATLLKVMPNGKVTPHIDAYRQAAINIPLSDNWTECYTGLYSARGIRSIARIPNILIENKIPKLTKGGGYPFAKLEEKLQYSKAICLNVSKIHSVVNNSNEIRYVLSISIQSKYSYNDVKELYNSGELI